MTSRSTTARAAAAATVLAAAALTAVLSAAPAGAAAPPWQDSNSTLHDPNVVGTLSFYDSAGHQIYSGTTDSGPFAAYVVGSSGLRSGDDHAYLSAYQPQPNLNEGAWSGRALGAAAAFPQATGPFSSAGTPVVSPTSGDTLLADFATDYANTSSASGYANVYELRLRTSKAGLPIGAQYDVADIKITGSTWQVIYPSDLTDTSTALSASPTSGAKVGQSLTLTATVSPAAAGTVQFKDGTSNLGAPVTVSSGSATKTTTPTTGGVHHYSAQFQPSNADTTAGSNGTLDYTVAKTTSVTTAAWPKAPHYGTAYTVTAHVTASGVTPTGTVSVLLGSRSIASATLSRGTATVRVPGTALAPGAHSLTLRYNGSTSVLGSSTAKKITVAKATSKTTNSLVRASVKRTAHGVLVVKVTAPGVTPTGNLTIYNGKSVLARATLKPAAHGTLRITLPVIRTVGKHSIHTSFAGSSTVAASSARAVTLTVTR